jgi:predicted transcriptional regulator
MSAQLPAVPPGPADTTHPRRALARLALSSAYREAADFTAGGVPTVSDEFGDPYDYVDHAARLLSIAQDVLGRAVVYARERGGTWSDIAEALDITTEQVRDHYTATVENWEDALNRPWERSGLFLSSRMPDGTTEPDQTAVDLDQWCLRHLDEYSGTRHNARHDGIEDHMVSVNLPKHTPVTEITSLTRTAAHLIERGTEATESEREAYETCKKTLLTKLSQVET